MKFDNVETKVFNINNLCYFHDENVLSGANVHFAIKKGNYIYDVTDDSILDITKEKADHIKYNWDKFNFVEYVNYNDKMIRLYEGLPEFDVDSDINDVRLYVYKKVLKKYAEAKNFTFKDLKKANEYYVKYHTLESKLINNRNNKTKFKIQKEKLNQEEKELKKDEKYMLKHLKNNKSNDEYYDEKDR